MAGDSRDGGVVRRRAPVVVDRGQLHDLLQDARRDVDSGLMPACQIAVARDGELLASVTYDRDKGELSGDARRFCVFSVTKPVVSAVIWQLLDEIALVLSDRIVDYIPEFGTNGKEAVTLEQVLTHTAGFPRAPLSPKLWNDREARLRRFGDWRLSSEPGTSYEYHSTSGHWVLAELIERVVGKDFRDAVHERVVEPIGLRRFRLGVPIEQQDDIYQIENVGAAPDPDMLEKLFGVRAIPGDVTEDMLLQFNKSDARRAGVPGAGGVSTAADIALFYQELLGNGHGLWTRERLDDVRSNIRVTLPDSMVGVAANRTIGFVVKGDDGFGGRRHCVGPATSPRTFAHAGAGGQIAWADPDTGISFCYLTCGLDRDVLAMGHRCSTLSSQAGALVANG